MNVFSEYESQIEQLSSWVKANTKPYQPLPDLNYSKFNEDLGLVYCNDGFGREGLENLVLFQYQKVAGFRRATEWTPLERLCRGIVFEKGTGKLVALSFPKFHNYSELAEDSNITDDDISHVSYKEDGSLGIIFHYNNQWWCSTHGSLGSEQGVHATKILRTKDLSHLMTDVTYLAEIVYKENRIVTDYGDTDDLILLDYISNSGDIIDGVHFSNLLENVFTFVSSFNHQLDDLMETWTENHDGTTRSFINSIINFCTSCTDYNFEGFVVTLKNGRKVKFKTFAYVAVHKSKFSITFKHVKRLYLESRESLYTWKAELPNEFFHLVDTYISALLGYVNPIIDDGLANALDCLRQIGITKEQFDLMGYDEINAIRKQLFPLVNQYPKDKRGFIWNEIKKQDRQKTFYTIAMPLTWKEVSGKDDEQEE